CVVATAARADARRRDIGGTKLPVRTAIEASTRETSPTAKPWVSGPRNRSRPRWAPSRLAWPPPAVAGARSGSAGRRNVGQCRPSGTGPTSIEDGVRGMAAQKLRGRLSRDWLFPRKTRHRVRARAGLLWAARWNWCWTRRAPSMGVDIADQINYDPAAYEASV